MNDELFDDIKNKVMLPLTVELQDHKEKVCHNAPLPSSNEDVLYERGTSSVQVRMCSYNRERTIVRIFAIVTS